MGFSIFAARSELNFRHASFRVRETPNLIQPRSLSAGLFSIEDASSSFRAGCGSTTAQRDIKLGKADTSCSTPSPPRLKPVATKRHPANRSMPRKPARPFTCSAQFQSSLFGRGGACGAMTMAPGSRLRIAWKGGDWCTHTIGISLALEPASPLPCKKSKTGLGASVVSGSMISAGKPATLSIRTKRYSLLRSPRPAKKLPIAPPQLAIASPPASGLNYPVIRRTLP